ncbi:MAG: hypothetical protein NC086_11435, partial [Alistipes sp.]|nr:hypothetical protein [Alistipes sp.]
ALAFVLPLLATVGILCMQEAYKAGKTIFCRDIFKDTRIKVVLVCVGSYLAGYLINSLYFGRYYTFNNYDTLQVTNFREWGNIYDIFEHLSVMVTDVFRLFGYVEGANIKSVTGIQSIAAIAFVIVFMFMIGVVYRSREHEEKEYLFKIFALMLIVMHIAVFIFIDHMYGNRYFILIYVFFIPLITIYFGKYGSRFLDLSKIANTLFIMCSVILCFTNLRDMVVHDDNFYIKDVVRFLEEEQATFGMATFWNGDILTELSDGKIQVININGEKRFAEAYEWLMPARFLERKTWETVDTEHFFVLLRFNDVANMEIEGDLFANALLENGKRVYDYNGYMVYFYDRDAFIDTYASSICID